MLTTPRLVGSPSPPTTTGQAAQLRPPQDLDGGDELVEVDVQDPAQRVRPRRGAAPADGRARDRRARARRTARWQSAMASVSSWRRIASGSGTQASAMPWTDEPHRARRGVPLEALHGDAGPADERARPTSPPAAPTRGPARLAGSRSSTGRPSSSARTQSALSTDTASTFCRSVGRHRQRGGGAAEGDPGVHPGVVAGEADDLRDQHGQLVPVLVRGGVVDVPGEVGEQRMGAAGVVAPPLAGQHGGHLHEAGALAAVPVLAAGQDRQQLGRGGTEPGMGTPT